MPRQPESDDATPETTAPPTVTGPAAGKAQTSPLSAGAPLPPPAGGATTPATGRAAAPSAPAPLPSRRARRAPMRGAIMPIIPADGRNSADTTGSSAVPPEAPADGPGTGTPAPAPTTRLTRVIAALYRLGLGGACAALLLWLLRNGPLVAPISLFSAANSQNGFYAASHIVAAMALAGAASGLWWLLSRYAAAPALGPAAAIALPLAALVVSTSHAVYPHDARYDLALALAFALFYLAAVAAMASDTGVPLGLLTVAVVATWLAVQGLQQFTSGQTTPTAWTGPDFASAIPIRISASLHNPNALAAALLLGIGAAAALAVGGRHLVWRVLGCIALVPLAAALPLTFSRGAYLGLAVAVGFAAIILPRGRRLRGLVPLLCVVLPIAAVAYKVPGVLFRVHGMSVQTGGDVSSRLFTWRDALAVWHLHPRWGAGPGGLQPLYAAHQPSGGTGTYVLIDVPGSADNDALQWLAETGWAGAALLGAGTLTALIVIARGLGRRGRDDAAAGAALLAALAGVFVQGLFEVTAYLLPIEAMLALAVAALTGLAGLGRPIRPSAVGRVLGVGVAIAGLGVANVLWQGWAPDVSFAAGWSQVQAAQPQAGLPDLRAAASGDTNSARNAAALGDAAVQAAYAASGAVRDGLAAEAATDLASALTINPWDGDTWAATAALLRLKADNDAVVCVQQAALQDFPYSPWYAAQLASDLTVAGLPGPARTDFAYAAALFPLQLAVYREYNGQTQPYYAQAQHLMDQGRQTWGAGPLPTKYVLPLDEATCTTALIAENLPADAYTRAIRGA